MLKFYYQVRILQYFPVSPHTVVHNNLDIKHTVVSDSEIICNDCHSEVHGDSISEDDKDSFYPSTVYTL